MDDRGILSVERRTIAVHTKCKGVYTELNKVDTAVSNDFTKPCLNDLVFRVRRGMYKFILLLSKSNEHMVTCTRPCTFTCIIKQ